jgi:hypothetical protein
MKACHITLAVVTCIILTIDSLGDTTLMLNSNQPQSANVNESSKYIGAATMEENGDIVMTLRAESKDSPIIGDAQFRYKPGSPGYADVLRHLGGLRPGETKPVLPWPNDP